MSDFTLLDFASDAVAARADTTGSGNLSSEWHKNPEKALFRKPTLLMIGDVVAVLVAAATSIILSEMFRSGGIPIHLLGIQDTLAVSKLFSAFAFIVAFVAVAWRLGLYTIMPARHRKQELFLGIQSALSAGLLLCGSIYFVHQNELTCPLIVLLIASSAASIFICRASVQSGMFEGNIPVQQLSNVLIVGTGLMSKALGDHLSSCFHLGYRVQGFLALSPFPRAGVVAAEKILAPVDRLRRVVRSRFIDEIVIGDECNSDQIATLIGEARELGISVHTLPWIHANLVSAGPVEYLGIYPVRPLHLCRPRTVSQILKRLIDLIVSSAMLIALMPLMLVVAMAIKADSPGPIFYISERIGRRGGSFPCFKFRSMVPNAEERKHEVSQLNERDGILFKAKNDPRITRVGAVLRKYSLDELPQLFNVLRGEMSMVGPRPPIASEVEQYDFEHYRRLAVPPGITGLWQVRARHDASFSE
jgi:exopolysaccharide biosynthesis polyprenyl glycosylphosphotransferase